MTEKRRKQCREANKRWREKDRKAYNERQRRWRLERDGKPVVEAVKPKPQPITISPDIEGLRDRFLAYRAAKETSCS